jgi:hypothetical protein
MQRIDTRSTTLAGAFLMMLLASLLLVACGSSSKGSSSTAAASSKAKGAPAGKAHNAARFKALQECLSKQGITLPNRTPGGQGAPPSSGGPPSGALGQEGGPRLPAGVSRAKFDAALKKCGGADFGGRGLAGGRFNKPSFRKALVKYAACLRQNGVNVPAPNTSGKGPVFSTKGLKTNSPKFQQAEAKCDSIIRGAFRGAPGTRPQSTNPGAPGPLGAVPTPNN